MTVPSPPARTGPLPCNGVTTVYNYGFKAPKASDLKVVHRTAAGLETELTLVTSSPGTDEYTAAVGDSSGSITTGSVYPTGDTITVVLDITLEQQRAFANVTDYRGETHESAYDELTMMVKQLAELIDRALLQPVGTAEVGLTVPDYEPGALFGWSATSQTVVNYGAGEVPLVPLAAWAQTFVQQSTVAAGRANVEVGRVVSQVAVPGTSDDNVAGYKIGDRIHSTTTNRVYYARDVSTGAAVWKQLLDEDDAPGAPGGDVTKTGSGSAGDLLKWVNFAAGTVDSLPQSTFATAGHTHTWPDLEDLANVILTGRDVNDVLTWNGVNWAPLPPQEGVVVEAPTGGPSYVRRGQDGSWQLGYTQPEAIAVFGQLAAENTFTAEQFLVGAEDVSRLTLDNTTAARAGRVDVVGDDMRLVGVTSGTYLSPVVGLEVDTTTGHVNAPVRLEENGQRVFSAGNPASALAVNSVTSAAIATGAVGQDELAVDAVVTSKIQDGAVTLDKHATVAANTLLGNPTGLTATPSAIALANINTDTPVTGTGDWVLGFDTAGAMVRFPFDDFLKDEAVTLPKLVHIGAQSFLGRTSPGTGDVQNLTASFFPVVSTPNDGDHLIGFATVSGSGELKRFELDTIQGAPKIYSHSHTWAIPGAVTVGAKHEMTVFLAAGESANLASCAHIIKSGTSATCKLTKNGVDVTGFTGISADTTHTVTNPLDVALANADRIELEVTAVSGSPQSLSFTINIEKTQ